MIELLVVVTIIAILAAMLLPSLQRAKDQAKTAKCALQLRQLGVALLMYVNDHRGMIPTAYPRCPNTYCPGSPANLYTASWLGTLYDLGYYPNLPGMHCPSDLVYTKGLYHGAYTFGFLPNYNTCSYGYNYLGLGMYGSESLDGWPILAYYGPFRRILKVAHPSQTYWVADNSDVPGVCGNLNYPYINALDDIPVWRHKNGLNMLWLDGHVTWMTTIEMKRHHYAQAGQGSSDDWWSVAY